MPTRGRPESSTRTYFLTKSKILRSDDENKQNTTVMVFRFSSLSITQYCSSDSCLLLQRMRTSYRVVVVNTMMLINPTHPQKNTHCETTNTLYVLLEQSFYLSSRRFLGLCVRPLSPCRQQQSSLLLCRVYACVVCVSHRGHSSSLFFSFNVDTLTPLSHHGRHRVVC